MASSESNTFEESTSTIIAENMPIESTPAQIELEMEKETGNNTGLSATVAPQRSNSYRGLRLSESEFNEEQQAEDSWWSEVENNDLLLDHVPNVTAVFTLTPEAILEKSISLEESESILKEENFERLHKIADKIKMTLSEHAKNKEIEEKAERERKLSETSDKENKTGYCENNFSNSTLCASKEQSLEEFKEEMRSKRLQRQTAVQDLRDEITSLRRQLALEREVNSRLCRGEKVEETSLKSCLVTSNSLEGACASDITDDEDPSSRSRHANIELANAQLALQMAQSENISLRGELAVVQKQVVTLKEVIACCKQMLAVKEEQCNELKQRLTEIEKSFAEHETKIMSDNLRQEYERQLVNIRQLRQLYEERQRVAAAEYENLQRLISIKRDELAQEQEKTKSLEERNQNLMKEVEASNNELACLRDECREHKFEKAALKEEIGAVNTLFSQMVMGFNGKNNLDIDRLTTMLEENRTLLNDMATKECTDGATLPKLLFELVEQATTTQDGNKKATKSMPTQFSRSPSPNHKTDVSVKLDAKISVEGMDAYDDDSVTEYENDNENMASLTSNVKQLQQQNEMPLEAEASTPHNSGNTSAASTDTFSQSHGNDDVDVDIPTNNPDEKVIVSAQIKSKRNHRKHATNKKLYSILPVSGGHASASATMQQLSQAEVIGNVTSAQEIVGNLPKVWRVLMELLSHHKIDPVQFEENGKSEDCYKSIETPNGPKAELSVSKTYIKLKDLILEKKSLVKETNRLKTLNSHLDYRLNEQEKRLSVVSLELTKTWHLVGKMQRQHRQLHTQEQILRYQLQQKRRLLSELKDELEYCRRKWAAARAKNDESQEQCNDLRREFARRKLEDANNSAESGYSDSGGPVSDEEAALAESVAVGVEGIKNANDGDDEDDDIEDANLAIKSTAGGCVNYRRKRLRELFEHTRKIKRMQSTSPGRAANGLQPEIMVLRWNSAPPTCSWREPIGAEPDVTFDVDGLTKKEGNTSEKGAIPKIPVRPSRKPKRCPEGSSNNEQKTVQEEVTSSDARSCRILRLEQQCKTLIRQVLETSDNRERLEVQLKRFQDEMSPAQHAVPLEELINKKRFERMTRASSVPVTGSGCLTAREEEYTRKRSERLERLEEESRQLMLRIKRTSDRGHYLRCSLDRIRRAPLSREGSVESNTDNEYTKPTVENEQLSATESNSLDNSQSDNLSFSASNSNSNPLLTADEEAYTARRADRLQRLEEESKQLLSKLLKNNQRGDNIGNRLDTLHERYKSQEEVVLKGNSEIAEATNQTSLTPGKMSIEQRIENIEKISFNREERLRILEEEGRQLINKLSETSERGTQMINRIAERELNRQKRGSSTPVRDRSIENNSKNNPTSEETPIAALLPTPKNVACSSIVFEELNERVTITTTPSQIAAHQGAIPKSKSTLQLLAARPKSARLQKTGNQAKDNANESLEDMVKRLQSLPFPDRDSATKQNETEENNLAATSVKEDIDKLENLNNQKPVATQDHAEKSDDSIASTQDTAVFNNTPVDSQLPNTEQE